MDGSDTSGRGADVVVLVPLKSFASAKGRLAPVLDPADRADLVRSMAAGVLSAAGDLGTVVVCDDAEVAEWARTHGAAVAWTPGMDLNEALGAAARRAADAGIERVIIAHGDLPFAAGLDRFASAAANEVVIVADRRGTGTNVMSLPVPLRFELRYGEGSFTAHRRAAEGAGLTLRVERDERLAWDVDEPADLDPPSHLGGVGALRA